MQEQEGKASEVVAMKMGQDDHIDTGEIDPSLLQGDQGGSSEVKKNSHSDEVDMDARLESATTAEGIAGSEKIHGYVIHECSDSDIGTL